MWLFFIYFLLHWLFSSSFSFLILLRAYNAAVSLFLSLCHASDCLYFCSVSRFQRERERERFSQSWDKGYIIYIYIFIHTFRNVKRIASSIYGDVRHLSRSRSMEQTRSRKKYLQQGSYGARVQFYLQKLKRTKYGASTSWPMKQV